MLVYSVGTEKKYQQVLLCSTKNLPEYGPLKNLIQKSAWRQARDTQQKVSNEHEENEQSTTIVQTTRATYTTISASIASLITLLNT
jgi:hypothetical protein